MVAEMSTKLQAPRGSGGGGGLSQKILKSRHSEMPFPAFSKRFFLLNGNIN